MASTSQAESPALIVEREDGVVRLTLNRPEKRNALTHGLIHRMETALAAIKYDQSVRAVVLAARGPVFSAGHDLNELIGREEEEYQELFTASSRLMLHIRRLPQPVIARVQGPAIAAGCQLVAACDLAVASETASFSTPGIKIGLFCSTPMVPLVRAIPSKAALEMLLIGEPISAARAWELGLINRVVAEDQLDPTIKTFTDAIEAMSPLAIRLGKDAFYDLRALDEPEAYRRATVVMTRNALLQDAQEGMTAFLEKRPAVWKSE
jgi:enoyl-CoA hydratase/carnithine racemase